MTVSIYVHLKRYITSKDVWLSRRTGDTIVCSSILPPATISKLIMIKKVISYFKNADERSKVVNKNIGQSVVYKAISIILSLLIVPLTIGFVNAEQYGIWLTISSIIGWIGYFDLGLGHGLRNRYATAKANGDLELASKLLSTAYAVIFLIFLFIFVVFCIINPYINWCSFLNVNQLDNAELQGLMYILVVFFCLNMTLGVLKSLMLGDQRASFTSKIGVAEQVCSLIGIFILSKTVTPSLYYLAFIYSGVPCAVYLIFSIVVYLPKSGIFRNIRPSFRKIDFSLSKSLLSLGVKFFIIQISLLLIFQCVNIIISRNCGQIAVTQYNLSYKYFQILYMLYVIVLTPYWSAFTDAYAKQDYLWMNKTVKFLNKLLLIAIPVIVLMVIVSPLFFKVWVGDKVAVPISLSLMTATYIYSQIFSGVYIYVINGLGKVTLQLVIYVISSIVAIPLMNLLSNEFGVSGMLVVLILIYSAQGIVGRIQINKILNNNAFGLWDR